MKTKIKHFYVRSEVDSGDGCSWLGKAIYYEPECADTITSYLEGGHIENGVERIASVVGKLCEFMLKKSICTREEMLEIFDIDYWQEDVR